MMEQGKAGQVRVRVMLMDHVVGAKTKGSVGKLLVRAAPRGASPGAEMRGA
jgi:hypothetical protein